MEENNFLGEWARKNKIWELKNWGSNLWRCRES